MGGRTAWPASHTSIDRTATEVQFFIDTLWAGLVPPFSKFFYAVLRNYRLQALHLHPNSVLLLSIFAYYCEAHAGPSWPTVDDGVSHEGACS